MKLLITLLTLWAKATGEYIKREINALLYFENTTQRGKIWR
jgi:hypothetical protein